MSFPVAAENFVAASRAGLSAELFWPGVGTVPASELVLRTLLPLAHAGLEAWHVDATDRDRYLGIIEQRCLRGANGATWQIATVHALEAAGLDRDAALASMTRHYIRNMGSNEPVHTWSVPSGAF
jgi:hypothetical protein